MPWKLVKDMWQYIVRRVIQSVFTLWVLSVITFGIAKLTPGSPLGLSDPDAALKMTQEMRDSLIKAYDLDKPVWWQYSKWLSGAMQGDLGMSLSLRNEHVQDILARDWPVSAQLGLTATLLAIGLGIPIGVVAAVKRNTIVDYISMFIAVVGTAVPNFVLAIVMILVFSVTLHWLPVTGWGTLDRAIMPVFVLMLGPLAGVARYTRSSVLEVVKQDYVRTAHAKGLTQRSIIFKHVLRNALIPVITICGPMLAGLLTGSFFVETMFTVPGIGNAFVSSINTRDYPMIMAQTMLFGALIVFLNLAVDLLYGVADPRIRYQ
jgi:ABC-type dipeptide/oligopeptide/nickel transport system permease component